MGFGVRIMNCIIPYTKNDEQKVIFTISFFVAAEGTHPTASAGVPGADTVNTISFCSVQKQSEVGETLHTCIHYIF